METKPEYITKALVPYQALTPQTWQMILGVAETVHKSRIFGTDSAEHAAAVMLKGYEIGLPLTASFEFIYAIRVGGKTRASLAPRGHLALIQQSPLCTRLEIEDIQDAQGNPWACRVTMERTNGFSYSATVTMDDARRANLVKPGSGWENWPANMLRWRATGFCADVVFPDIGGGMKRTDELANVNQQGELVDATPNDPWATISMSTPEKPKEPKIDMGFLTDVWGVDKIFEIAGNLIPSKEQYDEVYQGLKKKYPDDLKKFEELRAAEREQYPREEVF